jgi:hypothetical protein
MAAVLIPFGKSPGVAKEGELFNMRDKGDVKLYDKVIKPIMKKGEAFDLSSGSFRCSQDAQRSGAGARLS